MFDPLVADGSRYDGGCLTPSWLDGGCTVFVPDQVRQCVLFLGTKDSKSARFIPRATAFAVSIHEESFVFRYLVTAEHNISGFQEKGWNIYVRSNRKDGSAREDDWSGAHWHFHPDAGSTDVAVSTIEFHAEEEFKTVLLKTNLLDKEVSAAGTSDVLAKMRVGVGDEIFIVGLFKSHYGLERNIPIIRVGNIAMMKGEPVYTEYCGYTEAYLIEARSISGLSGSPAFVHVPVNHSPGRTQMRLLGLVHGHFDAKNLTEDMVVDDQSDGRGINTGIGLVIPVEKILETIDQPELKEMRRKAIIEHRKAGATADFAKHDDDEQSTEENPTHREDFTSLVGAAARKRPQGE